VLAPVLARLTDIPGITGARVECSGTYFLLTGADAAALELALPAIRDVLGPSVTRTEPGVSELQLAARARGELWFSGEGIRGLSYVEGRILAARIGDAVVAELRTDGETSERILEATRAEIFAALDHAHDTGGRASTGWFREEWPRIADGITARLAAAVPAALHAGLRSALAAQQ
jgi:hypothetical protein